MAYVSYCVIPTLEYGAGIWDYCKYQSTDNIQNGVIRYFLDVHRFALVLSITCDIGWLSVRWITIIGHWNRLVSMIDNRLIKQGFNMDCFGGKNHLCSDVNDIMTKLRPLDHFHNKTYIILPTMKILVVEHYNEI